MVLADVLEPEVWRAQLATKNVIATTSPPCPPWSRGGAKSGLCSVHGRTFLHAVLAIKRHQPLAVVAECADLTPKHDHFHLVVHAFGLIGFCLAWSQVVPVHAVTNNLRTRWIACLLAST